MPVESALVIVSVAVLGAIGVWRVEGLAQHFRPLVGHRRAIVSDVYSFSLVNLLIQLLPAMVILVSCRLAALRFRKRKSPDTSKVIRSQFVWTSATPFLIFLIFFMPDLGIVRDWDIYALAVPFLILTLVPTLDTLSDAIRPWLLPIAVISVIQTGAWVGVNASERHSLARYQETLEREPAHVGYAYEVLANYYEEKDLKQEAFDTWLKAHAAYGNPRYAINAGLLAAEFGRLDEAITLTRQGLKAGSVEHAG